MRYGTFDDRAREYVIDRPDTPRSWSNYLGSTRYGAIVTNNAGGYSFFRSAAQGRFTRLLFNNVPLDQPGRYVYLRDAADGDYWSASWQPVGKPLDQQRSRCRHGTGYTVIESEYREIASEVTYFVPLERDLEVWLVSVTNRGRTPRKLSLFTFLEYANEWVAAQDQGNLQYTQYIVRCRASAAPGAGGMIAQSVCHSLPERPDDFQHRDQSRHTFLALVGAPMAGFDTDRDSFLGGPYRSYREPLAVVEGRCRGTEAEGDNACGTFQVELSLEPGETREFFVLLGVGRAEREGVAAVAELSDVVVVRQELDRVRQHWHSRLGALTATTPDAAFDSMVNVWNAYNCLVTYSWSRAASLVYAGERDGLGYRDTVQDLLGVLPAIPEAAGERLRLMLTGQTAAGGAMPVVKPFAHRPGHEPTPDEREYRADDCLWLFETVPAYVKETGQLGFLDEVLPFADAGEATVLGHLRRALEFNLHHTGAHGLPSGLAADWNDTLVLGFRGESVFVALQLRRSLAVYAELAGRLARSSEAAWAEEQLAALDRALETHCFAGRWYVRAITDRGDVIGHPDAREGNIFLNAQTWAVLSGAARGERAAQVLDAVHERLATEYGLLLCDPPYTDIDVSVVRAVLFNPGMKENGAIFCHPQGWAVIAETMLGRGDRAYEYYRAYMPSAYNDRAEIRQVEPYVHCQSTHGRQSARFGASRLPWLTGTASWSYVAATQYLLGVRPDWDGLRVDPCIPAAWPGFRVIRRYRGATYDITIENPRGGQRGLARLTVDGVDVDPSAPLPVAVAGAHVAVRAELAG